MDFRILTLYYLSSFAGFIMIAGGIWLLYKQKIYFDKESNQITEIETPIGKFKTNIPALALFIVGFIPLIYPIWQISSLPQIEQVKLIGKVTASDYPVLVYAVIVSESLQNDREFSIQVPVDSKDREYKIVYIAGGGDVIEEERADISKAKDGMLSLKEKDIILRKKQTFEPGVIKDVPPEFR